MESTEDAPSDAHSPTPGPSHPVSRRDVVIGSGVAAGMLSIGVSPAGADDSEDESDGSNTRCLVTVTVTGLEAGGPMSDVHVTLGTEEGLTDESGVVTFEVGIGAYELRVEKERWESVSEMLTIDRAEKELQIPLHIDWYDDLCVIVRDASCGCPIKKATVSVSGHGSDQTDRHGVVLMMLERQLESTDHELTVTADGYRKETRQITIDGDERLTVELLAK